MISTATVVSILVAPFRCIADQPRLLLPLSLMLYVMAQLGMIHLLRPLSNFPPDGHIIPDGRVMGYSVAELNNYYDTLGVAGCRIYVEVANWDLFPFMPGYIFSLGALHVIASRKLQQSDQNDALTLLLVLFFDVVESILQRRGCVLYILEDQRRLSDWQIQLASSCVQMKFMLLFLSLVRLFIKAVQMYHQHRVGQKTR